MRRGVGHRGELFGRPRRVHPRPARASQRLETAELGDRVAPDGLAIRGRVLPEPHRARDADPARQRLRHRVDQHAGRRLDQLLRAFRIRAEVQTAAHPAVVDRKVLPEQQRTSERVAQLGRLFRVDSQRDNTRPGPRDVDVERQRTAETRQIRSGTRHRVIGRHRPPADVRVRRSGRGRALGV